MSFRFLCEGVRMHTVNGRKCEVKKALPRDDQSLMSSSRSSSELYQAVELSVISIAVLNTVFTFCSG